MEAIATGNMVECDVMSHHNELFLGHDVPNEKITGELLAQSDSIFFHAKDVTAYLMLKSLQVNTFMHDVDLVALTSLGQLWCFPGICPNDQNAIWLDLAPNRISIVVPETIYGVCGDYASVVL